MKRIIISLLLLILSGVAPVAAEGITVAVSIRPLHSLVASLMRGVAEPQLIVRSAGSAHGYNLRPSEQRLLQQADLVVWVGPELEAFLERPLGNLDKVKSLRLLRDVPQLQRLPARKGGAWGGELHGHGHGHGHDDASGIDPHVWLSPENARITAGAILQRLVRIDPKNAPAYRRNHDRLLGRLSRLDAGIASRLAHLRQGKYIVFHDAYQYFERHYGLNPVGALAVDPDRRPGARRLMELKEEIGARGVACIFSEPQFEPRLVGILTEGTTVRTGTLDPLGTDLLPGPDLYFRLLDNMASSLTSCLTGGE